MDLFHALTDGFAILRKRGVFTQAPLYRRGTAIYARLGSGFVKLLSNHNTTHPDVRWEDYQADDVAPGDSPLSGPRYVA